MLLSTINDSVCIKANLLINQTNPKKGNKAIVNEVSKLSEMFGTEFDYFLYTSLLEEIDFKDFKSPQNSVKTPKIQFLIQEFPNFLELPDFVNTFSMILDKVNLYSLNKVTAFEFFDCLSKLCKLNIENQLKVLIAMNLTSNETIRKDAGKVFASKCKEIEKEINLSPDTLQILITLARKHCVENSKIMDLFLACMNKTTYPGLYGSANQNNNNSQKDYGNTVLDSYCLIEDVYELFDTNDNSVELEKLYCDLGPMLINNTTNVLNSSFNDSANKVSKLIDSDIDESRLASFILHLIRNNQVSENNESKNLNKVFLRLLENETVNLIDENSDRKSFVNWNIENYYKFNKAKIDNLNQTLVIQNLDDPSFFIRDKKTLECLVGIFNKLKFNNTHQQLFNFIFKYHWKNEGNQLDIITFLLTNNSHDVFPFRNFSTCKVKKLSIPTNISNTSTINSNEANTNSIISALQNNSVGVSNVNINHISDSFCCIEVVQALLTIAQGNYYLKAKEVLSWAVENIPETLVLVFCELKISNMDFLAIDALKRVFSWNYINYNTQVFWTGTHQVSPSCSQNSILLIDELKNIDFNFTLKLLNFLYKTSNNNIQMINILELCQKTEIFLRVLNASNDFSFTIALALVASKREFLNLDQWIPEQIGKYGEVIIEAILNYIRTKVIDKIELAKGLLSNKTPNNNIITRGGSGGSNNNNATTNSNNEGNNNNTFPVMCSDMQTQMRSIGVSKDSILENAQLTLESLASIFNHLLNDQQCKQLNVTINKKLQNEISFTYKQIFEILDDLNFQNINTEEVEEQTNKLFDKYFKGETPLNELIVVLKQFKASSDVLENQILAYFIYSVFDEYRFYNNYPEQQLKSMSALMGQLICHKFLDGIVESIALKYILQSIVKSKECNMFKFAVTALEQFIDSIQNYPNFLEKLNKLNLKTHLIFEKVSEKYNEVFLKQSSVTTNNNNNNNSNCTSSSTTNNNNIINNSQLSNSNINNNNTSNQLNPNAKNYQYFKPGYYGVSNIGGVSGLGNLGGLNEISNMNNLGISGVMNPMNNMNNLASNNYAFNQNYFPEPITSQLSTTQNQTNNNNNNNNSNNNNSSNNNISLNNNNSSNQGNTLNISSNLNQNNLAKTSSTNNNNQGSFTQITNSTNNAYYNSMNSSLAENYLGKDMIEMLKSNQPPNSGSNSVSKNLTNINNNTNTSNNANDDDYIKKFNSNSGDGEIKKDNNSKSSGNGGGGTGKITSKQTRTKLTAISAYHQQAQKVSEILSDSIPKAPPEIVNKIRFIFNSMNKTNINEKSKDLKNILSNNGEQVLKWFSNYFILERVSTENNYHSVYNELIAYIDNKDLNSLLIKDTINYIKKLLSNDKIKMDDIKSCLKNLGSWLGIMTLAKNKPILYKDLDLKDLLFEAYETGKLQIILFFVCKILESSAKTKVFHAKNPYISTLLNILSEVCFKPNIKPNIKYEIEGLFKKLEVDLNSFVGKSKYLEKMIMCKDSNDVKLEPMSSPLTFNNLNLNVSRLKVNNNNNNNSNANSNLNSTSLLSANNNSQNGGSLEVKFEDLFTNVIEYEHWIQDALKASKSKSNDVAFNLTNKDFIAVLVVSYQSAINEIFASVADRAITISFAATKEIVKKDFFFEQDEKVYKHAFISSIKGLTSSLAMVTCKEPLRTTLNSNLKENLQKNNIDYELFSEAMNQITSNSDILDIGCYIIQDFVIRKALEKIEKDESLNFEFENRKQLTSYQHIKNLPLYSKFTQLPEQLKPLINPNLINPKEQELFNYKNTDLIKIYNDFDVSYISKRKESAAEKLDILRIIIKEFTEQCLTPNTTVKSFNSKLEILLKNIRTLTYDQGTVCYYPDCDENISELSKVIISLNIEKFLSIINLSKNDLLDHCNNINNILMKVIIHSAKHNETTLLNIYSEILNGFILLNSKAVSNYNLRKEITIRFLNNEDLSIRYIPEIHYYLIKKNIMDLDEWETFIYYFLKENSQYNLAKRLIYQLTEKRTFPFFSSDKFQKFNSNSSLDFSLKINDLNDYANNVFPKESSFKKLNFFMFSNHFNTHYFDLFFNKMNTLSQNPLKLPLDHKFFKVEKEQFLKIKSSIRAQLKGFVIKLYENKNSEKQIVLDMFEGKDEEQIIWYLIILTELVVEDSNNISSRDETTNSSSSSIPPFGSEENGFIIPVFVAIFIAKCIEYLNNLDKVKLLENALLGIFKVFSTDYVKNINNFNQKPYLRILTFLIKTIFEMNGNNEEVFKNCRKYQLFIIICDFLRILKPSSFPGFCMAWLDLISNSYLISALVNKNFDGKQTIANLNPRFHESEKIKDIVILKQEKYCFLLCEALQTLGLISNNLIKDFNMKLFYDSIIKIFYYLSISYPEFIMCYYICFIINLPITSSSNSSSTVLGGGFNSGSQPVDGYIQLKNIILSAGSYPYSFTTNSHSFNQIEFFNEDFKIDSVPEIKKAQEVYFDVVQKLKSMGLKEIIDESIFSKNNAVLEELVNKFSLKENYVGIFYFTSYIGINIKPWFESRKFGFPDLVEYFSKLLKLLPDEVRNITIHGILNEIKCLSPTTYFYGMLVLSLLLDCRVYDIEEILFRNILSRLLFKPHPSGLVWLIRDFIKNKKKSDDLIMRITKNNSHFDSIINDILNFVSESYKNLENYI